MTSTVPAPKCPDYGLDAPGVVRNLFLAGGLGWALFASAALGLWPGEALNASLAWTGFGFAVSLTLTGVSMVWHSNVGKFRGRERRLDRPAWRGAEPALA